jgi:DNA-directed RNA polymerase specialized sigma24 family protein
MDRDTEIGGGQDRFPPTRGSIIEGVRSDDPRSRERAWELLVAAYWKPIYKHIRMKWGASNEQAKDWTQGFFASAMEKPFVERYAAQKAGFRTYLRVCADGYVANERKAAGRAKRGGDQRFVSLDFADADTEFSHGRSPADDEESYFDRECARSLLERAIESFRIACEQADKRTQFSLFERYDLHSAESGKPPTYDQLAAEFNLPVTQVTNFLAWARRSFRRCVFDVLRELTANDEEFRDEARRVLGTTS